MQQSVKPAARKRVRLRPDIRSQQILDAALVEFSQHGFTATRIEDIAQGAGLSKGGIYAHFASKEDIFEALLARTLRPLPVIGIPETGDSDAARIAAFVEQFIDLTHRRLREPDVVAMLRLLIAESARRPDLIRRWHRECLLPNRQAQQQVLQDAVSCGLLKRSALTDNLHLAYAPALYAAIVDMVLHDGDPAAEMSALRQAHKQLMLDQLQAP